MAWWLHFKLKNWDSEDLPENTTFDVDVDVDVAVDVSVDVAVDVAMDVSKDITNRDTKITGRNLS